MTSLNAIVVAGKQTKIGKSLSNYVKDSLQATLKKNISRPLLTLVFFFLKILLISNVKLAFILRDQFSLSQMH